MKQEIDIHAAPRVVHCRREPFDVYIGRSVPRLRDLLEALGEPRGKALGCWCKPEPCHGDVLVELVTMVERE